ncbi:Actin protein 2/3 complex subunit 1B [Zea mays]|uniref:Actin protein 2/3 complex subunit 1B n=1 Tax=Zea mays TaxID=4577 RepID=A0A1D6QAV9_MAIZE|nr:Actin protein 2/3 complex subunit 1B [Zea mays]
MKSNHLLWHKIWHCVICLSVMWVLFVSERTLIGVGFDCNPMIFAADDTGLWTFIRFLDERKAAPSASKASQVYIFFFPIINSCSECLSILYLAFVLLLCGHYSLYVYQGFNLS